MSYNNEFDYSLWLPNSSITLANVPWDNTYRDVVYFESDEDAINKITQNGYTFTMEQMTQLVQGAPIYVNHPFSEVNRFNYLVARNGATPLMQQTRPSVFFYFITSVSYVSSNTTEITVQLDVFQTYSRRFEFGRCFIERGHLGIAAQNAFDEYGNKYLTVSEGIDTGAEYLNVGIKENAGLSKGSNFGDGGRIVVFNTSIDLEADWGDIREPKLKTSAGDSVERLPNATNMYVCTDIAFNHIVERLPTWVAQGILSVFVVDGGSIDLENSSKVVKTGFDGLYRLKFLSVKTKKSETLTHDLREHLRHLLNNYNNGRYAGLLKFYTAPYSMLELTNYTGTPLFLRPETVQSNKLDLTRHTHIAPPNPRIVWTVDGLNSLYYQWGGDDHYKGRGEYGDYFDRMTGLMNLPTFNVLNDRSLAYQASNAHSIAYGRESADWSQQKSLISAQNSYDVTKGSIDSQNALVTLGNEQNLANANLANSFNTNSMLFRSAQMAGNGFAMGGIAGGVGGIVGGVGNFVGTAMENNNRIAQANLANSFANRASDITTSQANYANDTNYSYAKWVAKGDYSTSIAGLNAKIQDSTLTPPSLVGQAGGDASMLVFNDWKLVLKSKIISLGALRFIGEYWLRYGYAMNVYYTPPKDFKVMEKFTYWKMAETTIKSADCPESFRQVIRGIFEKGVTVWSNMNDIANLDIADNTPIQGVRL